MLKKPNNPSIDSKVCLFVLQRMELVPLSCEPRCVFIKSIPRAEKQNRKTVQLNTSKKENFADCTCRNYGEASLHLDSCLQTRLVPRGAARYKSVSFNQVRKTRKFFSLNCRRLPGVFALYSVLLLKFFTFSLHFFFFRTTLQTKVSTCFENRNVDLYGENVHDRDAEQRNGGN